MTLLSLVSNYLSQRPPNKVLQDQTPSDSPAELLLSRETRRTLAQLRTNKSPLLVSYLFSIGDPRHPSPLCPLCLMHDHTFSHLFECKSLPTSLSSLDLWTNPDKVEPFLATWGERLLAATWFGCWTLLAARWWSGVDNNNNNNITFPNHHQKVAAKGINLHHNVKERCKHQHLIQLIILSLYTVYILTLDLLILSFNGFHLIWLIVHTMSLYVIITLILLLYTQVFLRVQFLALYFSPCILSLCLTLLTHTLSYIIHLPMTYNYRCLLPQIEYLSYFTLCSHV